MHAENVESVGAILRRAREAGGLSLRAVSNELKIRTCHLEAIEADRHDRLPALAFSTGFVRSYARHLGLDAAALATAWRGASDRATPMPMPEPKLPEPIAESRLPDRSAIALAVAAVIAIYFGWIADFGLDPGNEAVAPVPARLAGAVLDETPGLAADGRTEGTFLSPAAAQPAQPPANGGSGTAQAASLPALPSPSTGHVELVANKDCWIRVIDKDGAEVWSGVLKAGESWSPRSEDLRLMTSNAGGLRVIVDGEEIGLLGEGGAIVRDVPLDAERLRKREKLAMN